jgi:hypothetical protein
VTGRTHPSPSKPTDLPVETGGLLMRSSSPWFRPCRNTWFVEIAGKQQVLGKHPEGAPTPKKGKNGIWNAPPEIMAAFHKLMATSSRKLPQADTLKVCQVCDLFLDYADLSLRGKHLRRSSPPASPASRGPQVFTRGSEERPGRRRCNRRQARVAPSPGWIDAGGDKIMQRWHEERLLVPVWGGGKSDIRPRVSADR